MRARRCAALLALVLTACGAPPRTPDVILIVLDTLRADHLGAYGYPLDTSPHLDAFAAGATRYAQAYATSPWTLPSHASLFTGRFPFEHGVHTLPRGPQPPGDARPRVMVRPLGEQTPTLAGFLRRHGFATGAIVANAGFLTPGYGLARGFDEYRLGRVPAPQISRMATRWIEEHRGAPYFLFLNYMDTHRPYNTAARPDTRLPRPPRVDSRELLDQLTEAVMTRGDAAPAALVRGVLAQYDVAIANLDDGVGLLLEWLVSEGLFDDTLVVITSDHGEFFGEHRLVEHSKDLYEPVLRIPLIVKTAGQERGRVVVEPVSLADLPRLILGQLPEALARDAEIAFPYTAGNHPLLAENYFSRGKDLTHPIYGQRFQRIRAALIEPAGDRTWKYIRSSDGAHELYDLAADPAESRNLIGARSEVAQRLSRGLEAFRPTPAKTSAPETGVPLDDAAVEQLRELGYLVGPD